MTNAAADCGAWRDRFEPVSEDAIARAFTDKFGTTLQFDHDVGRWFQWTGSQWKQLRIPVAFSFARILGRQLGYGKRQICKASVAAGAERFAAADPIHAVTSEVWDRDPWLLGTPCGTVDLRTGAVRPADPSDRITKLAGCPPKKARPARWLTFLAEATNGDSDMIAYLQRITGYCLTGVISEHALFFIYGPGGNGKSVFLNVLTHILGEYATAAPMETFTRAKFSQHPTELAMLKGARLVTASETEEGRSWAEARIKSLTGGDPITARFMRRDFFTYSPHFKLVFAGNHQPTLHSADVALQRRVNMLPFVSQPPRPDPFLEEKLKSEAPAILAWAIEGCLQWQAIGLARPETVSQATEEYFDEQDVFGQWLRDHCELKVSYWEQPTPLFRDWGAYARDIGEEPGSMISFSSRLKRVGLHRGKVSGMRVYKGVRLRNGGSLDS